MDDKIKILIAEDDENLSYILQDNLQERGYEVTLCCDGESAWQKFLKAEFHIAILDVMMPNLDGFELASRIRKYDENIYLLFLSSRSLKEDRIKGLQLGADDYITKPFSLEELHLKLQVAIKRCVKQERSSNIYRIGSYTFHYSSLSLCYQEQNIQLTQKEADILRLFCLQKNQIVRREYILQTIWGDNDYFMGRSLDVFISKMRKYLRYDQNIEIVNIHGVGFKLTEHFKDRNS